jgi:chromosome segregation ATPase
MKKLPFIIILTLFFSCDNSSNINSEEQLAIDSLKLEIQSRNNQINDLESNVENSDSLVNQYALYVKQIKDNLNEINDQEVFLNKLKNSDSENIKPDTLDIIKSIQLMADKITENEQLIGKLNKVLNGAKTQNLKFRKEINTLQEMIAKSNKDVYFLKEELSSLNASYSELFDKYNAQKVAINQLNSSLNEISYVIGTKSELLENGVLTKEGGIIGIGKARKLSNELNVDYFTKSSKTKFKSLILGFKSIKIITSHPKNSYKLTEGEKERIDSLIILDKSSFWKNSKYLVIEVK